LAQGDEAEQATIPVERINGPVLLLSGADDQLWPSPAPAEVAVLRLVAHGLPGRPHEARHVRYPGAGHCFPLPNLPAGRTARDPVLGRTVTFGGTAAGNARAADMAWRETLAFLDAWRRP
jgi:dienelactone hydrolase